MPISSIEAMASKTVSGLAGAAQTIGGLIGRHNNEKNLANLANPVYTPIKALSDYYQTALNRYNAGTYNSQFYQNAEKTAQRNLATGINTLQDRRSALAGIPALVEGTNQSLDKAAVQAEGLQRQNFGQLGQAANMKTADDRYAFDINKMMPFERRYSELTGKLAANNQMINAGINNLFTGFTGGGSGGSLSGLTGGMGGMGGGGINPYGKPSYSNGQFND